MKKKTTNKKTASRKIPMPSKHKGCNGCGSTTADLRFGWCFPCVEKAEKKKKKK